uniref:Peptidase metallopeptidase domain-containing protein n=1 Tax=Panagrolaimus davidi TaxID=227884 RepID=A0A914PBK2_9BILA
MWATYIPIEFFETNDLNGADIKISFARRFHGDAIEFDGRGGTFAHADSKGTIHFDGDEKWKIYSSSDLKDSKTIDLLSAAVHEIGHVLGLDHSNADGSIMAQIYQDSFNAQGRWAEPKITPDDIQKVQSFYGMKYNQDRNTGELKKQSRGIWVPKVKVNKCREIISQ